MNLSEEILQSMIGEFETRRDKAIRDYEINVEGNKTWLNLAHINWNNSWRGMDADCQQLWRLEHETEPHSGYPNNREMVHKIYMYFNWDQAEGNCVAGSSYDRIWCLGAALDTSKKSVCNTDYVSTKWNSEGANGPVKGKYYSNTWRSTTIAYPSYYWSHYTAVRSIDRLLNIIN